MPVQTLALVSGPRVAKGESETSVKNCRGGLKGSVVTATYLGRPTGPSAEADSADPKALTRRRKVSVSINQFPTPTTSDL